MACLSPVPIFQTRQNMQVSGVKPFCWPVEPPIIVNRSGVQNHLNLSDLMNFRGNHIARKICHWKSLKKHVCLLVVFRVSTSNCLTNSTLTKVVSGFSSTLSHGTPISRDAAQFPSSKPHLTCWKAKLELCVIIAIESTAWRPRGGNIYTCLTTSSKQQCDYIFYMAVDQEKGMDHSVHSIRNEVFEVFSGVCPALSVEQGHTLSQDQSSHVAAVGQGSATGSSGTRTGRDAPPQLIHSLKPQDIWCTGSGNQTWQGETSCKFTFNVTNHLWMEYVSLPNLTTRG